MWNDSPSLACSRETSWKISRNMSEPLWKSIMKKLICIRYHKIKKISINIVYTEIWISYNYIYIQYICVSLCIHCVYLKFLEPYPPTPSKELSSAITPRPHQVRATLGSRRTRKTCTFELQKGAGDCGVAGVSWSPVWEWIWYDVNRYQIVADSMLLWVCATYALYLLKVSREYWGKHKVSTETSPSNCPSVGQLFFKTDAHGSDRSRAWLYLSWYEMTESKARNRGKRG